MAAKIDLKIAAPTDRMGTVMGHQDDHSLASESIEHQERARYLAAAAVKDLQCGRAWNAEGAMRMAAMERHLAYEKWDTAQIAWAAQKECWDSRR